MRLGTSGLAAAQVPLDPPCEPLTGDSHAHLIPPLVAFAGSLGYSVSSDPIPGRARGFCDTKAIGS